MDNCNKVPKVAFDPGWNDPPTFSYNAQQTTPNRPRNFLNKRVAFPLSEGSSTAAPMPANLPPMPSVPPIPTQTAAKLPSSVDNDLDSASTLMEVKNILIQFLEDSSELGPKANDIKRRIEVMEEMWSVGKLDPKVYVLMRDLAYALKDNKPSRADDLHRALMVDHVSAVGTWMPGIKQLIHHCIARSELLALDEE